jgi:hypothetical protein
VAPPPSTGLAHEEVRVVIDGVEQVVEIVRQDRIHGQEAYWLCPRCSALRWHLYLRDGVLACRVCHGLSYRSQHVPTVVARAARLRRKLGAEPSLLSPLPPRPRNIWRAAWYDRLVRELAAQEAVIAEMLGATIQALERRKGRLHGPR